MQIVWHTIDPLILGLQIKTKLMRTNEKKNLNLSFKGDKGMCDNMHNGRIEQYGYCSVCKTTTPATPAKIERAKNHKKSD